jgi:hypothetical protein
MASEWWKPLSVTEDRGQAEAGWQEAGCVICEMTSRRRRRIAGAGAGGGRLGGALPRPSLLLCGVTACHGSVATAARLASRPAARLSNPASSRAPPSTRLLQPSLHMQTHTQIVHTHTHLRTHANTFTLTHTFTHSHTCKPMAPAHLPAAP